MYIGLFSHICRASALIWRFPHFISSVVLLSLCIHIYMYIYIYICYIYMYMYEYILVSFNSEPATHHVVSCAAVTLHFYICRPGGTAIQRCAAGSACIHICVFVCVCMYICICVYMCVCLTVYGRQQGWGYRCFVVCGRYHVYMLICVECICVYMCVCLAVYSRQQGWVYTCFVVYGRYHVYMLICV